MNTKTFLSILLILSACITSCKKELEPQDSSDTPLTENSVPNIVAPVPVSAPQPVQVTPVNQPAQNTPVAKGMNPPHGQPNHRCDIAVGAPLNSAPAKQNQAVVQSPAKPGSATIQQMNPNQPAPALVSPSAEPTPAGMNPPHGQEGHLCSVAVGAPLPKAEKTE